MRQAINNLQSTYYGFKLINQENVYKVCDQPHPNTVRSIISSCKNADLDIAITLLHQLYSMGYSSSDIIQTFFRVVKNMTNQDEFGMAITEPLQLEFLKEIGQTHMKILDGLTSLVQLTALLAKLVRVAAKLNNNQLAHQFTITL